MFKFMDSELQESVTKVCESLRMYHVACEAIDEFGEETSVQKKFEVIDQFDKEIINESVIPKLEKWVKEEILKGAHHEFKYRYNNSHVIYYIDGVPFCSYGAMNDEVAFLLQLEKSESYKVGNQSPDDIVRDTIILLSDFVYMSIEQFAQKYCSAKNPAQSRPGVERLLTEMKKRMVVSPLLQKTCSDKGRISLNDEKLYIGTICNSDEFLLDVMQYLGLNEEYNVTYADGEYTVYDTYVVDSVSINILFDKSVYEPVAKRIEVQLSCNKGKANLSIKSLIEEKTGEDFGLSYVGKMDLEDWLSEKEDVQPEIRTITAHFKESYERMKKFERNFMEDYHKESEEEEEEDFDEDEIIEPPYEDFYPDF